MDSALHVLSPWMAAWFTHLVVVNRNLYKDTLEDVEGRNHLCKLGIQRMVTVK
jgi:hypothetical protein